jgi:hypothetical protein
MKKPMEQNKTKEQIAMDWMRENLEKLMDTGLTRGEALKVIKMELIQAKAKRIKASRDKEPKTDSNPAEEKNKQQEQSKADSYGANNKLVTRARYEELKERMKKRLNNLNSGLNPEIQANDIIPIQADEEMTQAKEDMAQTDEEMALAAKMTEVVEEMSQAAQEALAKVYNLAREERPIIMLITYLVINEEIAGRYNERMIERAETLQLDFSTDLQVMDFLLEDLDLQDAIEEVQMLTKMIRESKTETDLEEAIVYNLLDLMPSRWWF